MESTILNKNLWAPKAPKTSLFPEFGWGGGENLPWEVIFLAKCSKWPKVGNSWVLSKNKEHHKQSPLCCIWVGECNNYKHTQFFGILMENDHNHKGNPLLFGTFAKRTRQDCGKWGMTILKKNSLSTGGAKNDVVSKIWVGGAQNLASGKSPKKRTFNPGRDHMFL